MKETIERFFRWLIPEGDPQNYTDGLEEALLAGHELIEAQEAQIRNYEAYNGMLMTVIRHAALMLKYGEIEAAKNALSVALEGDDDGNDAQGTEATTVDSGPGEHGTTTA